MGATMGDEAMIMCNKGFQMVANHSTSGQGLEAIQDVRVICSQDGIWQRPFQYHCMDEEVHQELLAKVCCTLRIQYNSCFMFSKNHSEVRAFSLHFTFYLQFTYITDYYIC